MEKDFIEWHGLKTKLQAQDRNKFFQERELWFCSIGMNLGSEIDGKQSLFLRPVIVIRKFTSDLFWGIPLTSTFLTGSYFYQLDFRGRISTVLLLQMRLLDRKRLFRKVGTILDSDFVALQNQLKNLLTPSKCEIPPRGRDFSEAEANVPPV